MTQIVNCVKTGKALPGMARPPFPGALGQRIIEFWLAGITLLGMLAGWAAGNWAGPRALMIAAYTAAYVAGGYFGLRASLQALRRGIVEID